MNSLNRELEELLCERLRCSRDVEPAVDGALPILFFGDIESAKVATVGINPSDAEYVQKVKDSVKVRDWFHTVGSLGAESRSSLKPEHCEQAIARMRDYFTHDTTDWFRTMSNFVEGLGVSYKDGSAIHLDLVQESTKKKWKDLKGSPSGKITKREDTKFLCELLRLLPVTQLFCDGATVCRTLFKELGAEHSQLDGLLGVMFRHARVTIGNRTVSLFGWHTRPLGQLGLEYEAHRQLGRELSIYLAKD